MTRLVLDTNVLVSALLFGSEASRLLELWQQGRFRLAVSPDILTEYLRVLAYPKFGLSEHEVKAIAGEFILPYCDVFQPQPGPAICPDPDDDKFLHCAIAAKATAIVSGDKDILGLGPEHAGIPILTVAKAVTRFGN